MALFANSTVYLELRTLAFKEKRKIRSAITENGGNISYIVCDQCSLVVASGVANLSALWLRCAQKYNIPIVSVDYVSDCVKSGVLLPVEEYKLDVPPQSSSTPPPPNFTPSVFRPPKQAKVERSQLYSQPSKNQSDDSSRRTGSQKSPVLLGKFRLFSENDADLPNYPSEFQVAKYSIFQKANSSTWSVLELQSAKEKDGYLYRVVRFWSSDTGAKAVTQKDKIAFLSTSEEALEVYTTLRKQIQEQSLKLRTSLPPDVQDLGSEPLKQLLLEEKLNTGSLSQEVGVLVELLWREALGCLDNILRVPATNLSLNDVSRAEGLLLQAQKKLKEATGPGTSETLTQLMDDVYTLIPHKLPPPPASPKLLSQKLDLCQLIRDVLNVSEATLRSPSPSCLGKYRALRCSIERVPPGTLEFQNVTNLLQDRKVQVQQVLRLSRSMEQQMFRKDLGNVKALLHSSSPSSFVGILSRGLLLPHMGVEHHGIERTDIGNLGGGIYFTDAMSASLKYSKSSETDGSRLLLVCDVALGRCVSLQKRDPSLSQAPDGYHSVHGVRRTPATKSEFEDDEYVVYRPDQVRLKYLVQFSLSEDHLKEFCPTIDTSAELPRPIPAPVLSPEEEGIGTCKNPLEDVTAGLLDSAGQQLPLEAVHVRCKLMDLLSQVVIFQKYTNKSSVPIEAKYVFPLDGSAAVCGFEAFINGKHVIGQVKEKEKARREYKKAIEEGHGAYLMDQDAPDVFTISVGNLPPNATVLIKVTFVSELIVMAGRILFNLPGSVAPWQQSAALHQTTQATVEKVCVTDLNASKGEFTLDMAIEMPQKITYLNCSTHRVRIKKTDCKAVLSVLPEEVLGAEGFQLSICMYPIHLPRMWVENHPDKDSQACMLVFYPNFDTSPTSTSDEVIILVDTSESMIGEALQDARKIVLQILSSLEPSVRVNVVFFGTDHQESFQAPQAVQEAIQPAKKFVRSTAPLGGSTDLWRPLRVLSLLPPSRCLRNILLLSDGHIQNQSLTLQLVRDSARHSRLFTCGLSSTANQHILRILAQAGGGAYEYFDTKNKHTWTEKVRSQVKRLSSPGCSSVSVKWQQFNPTAPSPVQAPAHLHALFNDCHTLVYGFVPHCTQATLLGNLSGQEIQTMVSTSELQKTKGTFLHKLTARAVIRDYEDGVLDANEAEHEGKKAELKSFITELSKEFSILSQFTSFVAIEERDSDQAETAFTDVPKLIAEEDVDFLPYLSWEEQKEEAMVGCALSSGTTSESEPSDSSEFEPSDSELEDGYAHDDVSDLLCEGYSAGSGKIMQQSDRQLGYYADYQQMYCADIIVDDETMPSPGQSDRQSCDDVEFYSLFCADIIVDDETMPGPGQSGGQLCDYVPSNSSDDTPAVQLQTISSPGQSEAIDEVISAPKSEFSRLLSSITVGKKSRAGGVLPKELGSPNSFAVRPEIDTDAFAPPPPPPPPPNLALTIPIDLSHPPQRKNRLLEQPIFGSGLAPPAPPGAAPFTCPLPAFLSSCMGFPAFGRTILPQALPGLGSSPLPVQKEETCVEMPGRTGIAFGSTPDIGDLDIIPQDPAVYDFSHKDGNRNVAPKGFSFRARPTPRSGSGLSLFGSSPLKMVDESESLDHGYIPCALTLPKPSQDPLTRSTSEDSSKSTMLFGSVEPTEFPHRRLKRGVKARVNEQTENIHHEIELHGSPRSSFHSAGIVAEAGKPAIPPTKTSQQNRSSRRSGRLGEPEKDKDLEMAMSDKLQKRMPLRRRGRHMTAPQARSFSLRSTHLDLQQIFQMQHPEGYWECTADLGAQLGLIVNIDSFVNVFLKNKGICSLGPRAHADILRLLATLLVLQLLRLKDEMFGKHLHSLFQLDDLPHIRIQHWEAVKKAVDWVRCADRQYPCVCSRLEFGWSWESSTRQLLGYDELPPFSPLHSLVQEQLVSPVC